MPLFHSAPAPAAPGAFLAGLLVEAGDAAHRAGPDALAGNDITVAGLGPVGADAEQGDMPVLRRQRRLGHGRMERRLVGYQMVGRHDQVQRLVLLRLQRGHESGGGGIAPRGSSSTLASVIFNWSSASRIKNLWSILPTITGAVYRARSPTRFSVALNSGSSLTSGTNCLGYCLRDTGHSRVPDPPERITGQIFAFNSTGLFIVNPFPIWRGAMAGTIYEELININ